jgi:hypothetical protein
VDEPQKAAANGTASGPGAKQQQPSSAGGPAAAAKKQGAKKRVANTDLVTGEVIPDMGVHGVFDVLYELGSGGSGRTFLCRCDLAGPATSLFQTFFCRMQSSMRDWVGSAQAASNVKMVSVCKLSATYIRNSGFADASSAGCRHHQQLHQHALSSSAFCPFKP